VKNLFYRKSGRIAIVLISESTVPISKSMNKISFETEGSCI